MENGTLFIVSTPIGNLEDITLRAIRVLKEVGLIAAEDTRVTKKLLSHYGIAAPLTSYYEHNEKEKAPFLIDKLKAGIDVALVSDAGTPGISDPGYRLIRLAIENTVKVSSIPGPSALITVLSVSGLSLDNFCFTGFVPASGGEKKKFFLSIKVLPQKTFVMYDSPRRVHGTLDTVIEVLGDVECVLAREMTKIHEEVLRGRVSSIRHLIDGRELKGEITLVLRTEARDESSDPGVEIENLLRSGLKVKDIVNAISVEFGLSKKEIYREALRIKEDLKL